MTLTGHRYDPTAHARALARLRNAERKLSTVHARRYKADTPSTRREWNRSHRAAERAVKEALAHVEDTAPMPGEVAA